MTSSVSGAPAAAVAAPIQAEAADKQNSDVSAVQLQVAESVKTVTKNYGMEFVQILTKRMDYKQLAAKHVYTQEQLSAEDAKVQMVFKKLSEATTEHIAKFSKEFLVKYRAKMADETSQKDADQFFSYFVHKETNLLIGRLTKLHPMTLESPQLWI